MDKVINWDEYFMGVAALSALRSKDPKCQVGACIVNTDKRIVGIGYNGMPHGILDTTELWESEAKLNFVVHAEANAILNSTVSLKGATLYVTKFPCNECAKLIVQSGIKEVVFQGNTNPKFNPEVVITMFRAAGIKFHALEKEITVTLNS